MASSKAPINLDEDAFAAVRSNAGESGARSSSCLGLYNYGHLLYVCSQLLKALQSATASHQHVMQQRKQILRLRNLLGEVKVAESDSASLRLEVWYLSALPFHTY